MKNNNYRLKRKIVVTSVLIGCAELLSGTNFFYIPILGYIALFIFSIKSYFYKKPISNQLALYFVIELIIASVSFIEISQNKSSKIAELYNVVKTYHDYYQLLDEKKYKTEEPSEISRSHQLLAGSSFRFEGDFFSCKLFCLSGVNFSTTNFLSGINVKDKCLTENLCFKAQVTNAVRLQMAYEHESDFYTSFPDVHTAKEKNKELVISFAKPVSAQDRADIPLFLRKDHLSMNDCIHIVQNFISNPLYHLVQEKVPVIIKVNTNTVLKFKNANNGNIGCKFRYSFNETLVFTLDNKI
jgi:hypothetical protein